MVVHYAAASGSETAEEIDRLGEGGPKTTKGTATHFDRTAKTVAIKTAHGTEQASRLTGCAAEDAGKDIPAGAKESGKATVGYSERAGHRVAHVFRKSF